MAEDSNNNKQSEWTTINQENAVPTLVEMQTPRCSGGIRSGYRRRATIIRTTLVEQACATL